MEISFPLRIILTAFLAVVVAGCGEQISNPVIQEQDYASQEGLQLALMSMNGLELADGPYPNFRFQVEIDGIIQAGFCEVIMPGATVDILNFQKEGKSKVSTEYDSLILKWGITGNMDLHNWFRNASDGNVVLKNLSVILLSSEMEEVARWNFRNAWPAMYYVSDFDALGNEIAIEALGIKFERMERVN
ncbi:phage tail protein [Candidatus Poribacteria bacterium]